MLPDLLKDLIVDVWQKYGPFSALLILFFIYYDRRIRGLYERIIRGKDAEIDRVVNERNRLQEIILQHRLSTTRPPELPPGQSDRGKDNG